MEDTISHEKYEISVISRADRLSGVGFIVIVEIKKLWIILNAKVNTKGFDFSNPYYDSLIIHKFYCGKFEDFTKLKSEIIKDFLLNTNIFKRSNPKLDIFEFKNEHTLVVFDIFNKIIRKKCNQETDPFVLKVESKHGNIFYLIKSRQHAFDTYLEILQMRDKDGYYDYLSNNQYIDKPEYTKEEVLQLPDSMKGEKTKMLNTLFIYETAFNESSKNIKLRDLLNQALQDDNGAIAIEFMNSLSKHEYNQLEFITLNVAKKASKIIK